MSVVAGSAIALILLYLWNAPAARHDAFLWVAVVFLCIVAYHLVTEEDHHGW